MMITKIKSDLVPLTRELAQQFKDMKPVDGERELKQHRLNFFRMHLEQKTYVSPNWAKAVFSNDPDDEYRADGQHAANTLAECEESLFPQGLMATINTYRIDGVEDLAPLFDIFDNPLAARTNAEKLGVYTAHHQELHGMDKDFLNKVAHGINYHYAGLKALGQQGVVLYAQRQHGLYYDDAEHRNFAVAFYPLREAKHAWMFGKVGLVAEIFADWHSHAELAERFWREVMTESNPDVEDETRELATTLRDWSKKQPRVKQDKFRSHAKKMFDRYKRAHTVQPLAA